jgi:hypothetical protein
MMFNATFNNISIISWRSDLLLAIYKDLQQKGMFIIVAVSFFGGGNLGTRENH